jgi:glycosyltransferase involved in cell wall biosynthesis
MVPTAQTISVVIPAFNAEKYLKEAVDSVLEQTIPVTEILVVDDGSTDRTADIVRAYGDPVKYFYQSNHGVGHACNRGASLACGEFIGFQAADDLWVAEKLERQLDAFHLQPDLDMVFVYVQQFVSPELSDAERARFHCPERPEPGYLAATMLVRRTAFERVGPFITHVQFGDFIDWYDRARSLGLKEAMLPEVLFKRRIHTTNLSILQRHNRVEFARVIKGIIDRKRRADRKAT